MQPAGVNDWAPVEVNRPFTTGDYLYTDQKAIAEVQLDSAVFRMGEVTSFGFLNLNDEIAQLKLTEGDLHFRVHDLAPNQAYEIDTPNAAISLLRDGVYRIHVDPNSNTTFLVVREGQAEVTGGGEAFTLSPGQSANLSGSGQLAYDIEQAPAPDVLDNWSAERDRLAMQRSATQYVPPSMIGYQDLNENGTWDQTPEYGPVWYPTHVQADWAPYHYGHWAWIEPWGWTWVDDAPWGFAPCHYGRWVYRHERWGWAPGPVAVVYAHPIRPVYAPALVAWFGGSHWGVSVSVGGGPSLGWVPLGYGEIYTPHYHCSPRYFEHVNVYNTRVVNNVNITNVYKTVYVQHNVYEQRFVNVHAPRAVVSMQSSAFAGGRPVQQFARPVDAGQFSRMRNVQVITPGVAPTRGSIEAGAGRPVVHPAAAFANRPVIVHATPATVVPFEQRQAYLQQHAGQLHDFEQMHRTFQAQARPVALVHAAPQARPIEVHPGQRVGNPPPASWSRGPSPNGQPRNGEPQIRNTVPQAQNAGPQVRNTEPQPHNAGPQQQQPHNAAPVQGENRPAAHGLPPNQVNRTAQTGGNQTFPQRNSQPGPGATEHRPPQGGNFENRYPQQVPNTAQQHQGAHQQENPPATYQAPHPQNVPPNNREYDRRRSNDETQTAPHVQQHQPVREPRTEAAPYQAPHPQSAPPPPHPVEPRPVEPRRSNVESQPAPQHHDNPAPHPEQHGSSGHAEQHHEDHHSSSDHGDNKDGHR
jgi:hypothetical protein